MGHLPIVDRASFDRTIGAGAIRIRASLGQPGDVPLEPIMGQVADLFADALAPRPGDLVFPWIIKPKGGASFTHSCLVAGRAVLAPRTAMPLVVPLQPKQRIFPGITEAEALNLWPDRILWNAIGKKSLRRGRSLTHQSPLEDSTLMDHLLGSGRSHHINIPLKPLPRTLPITINTREVEMKTANHLRARILRAQPGARLGLIRPAELQWVVRGEFSHEKALEAWVMENYDLPKGGSLRSAMLRGKERIVWAGNYLPFGVAGASIDLVFWLETPSGRDRLVVVELKKGRLGQEAARAAGHQVLTYADFIRQFLDRFGREDLEVSPVVLSRMPARRPLVRPLNTVTYLGYQVDAEGVVEVR